MNKIDLAYLAGAIDSDGCFMIRRCTYRKRVTCDADNPTYSERVCLKQVTPQIPELLHQVAGGGSLRLEKASCKDNGKPLYTFDCTNKIAAALTSKILPYLRVKKRHAELIMELRASKSGHYNQLASWFVQEHPTWKKEPMVTATEACRMLGYTLPISMTHAIRNGTVVALPHDRSGPRGGKPRFPKALIEGLLELRVSTNGEKKFRRPKQLIEWRERLWAEMKTLNKVGKHGTQVNHLTGCHTPK